MREWCPMSERSRRDRLVQLGELQLEMLDVLANLGEATVYDLMAAFPEDRRPRSSTVQTVMRALERKGLATHSTSGRTFVYRVTKEAGQARGSALRDVLARVFRGSPEELFATLLDVADCTPEELAALRRLVEEKEARGDGD
jgi:BlaI family transcriptional regulator, penicillinase repressor